jgi:hypothetical protein
LNLSRFGRFLLPGEGRVAFSAHEDGEALAFRVRVDGAGEFAGFFAHGRALEEIEVRNLFLCCFGLRCHRFVSPFRV